MTSINSTIMEAIWKAYKKASHPLCKEHPEQEEKEWTNLCLCIF